MIMAFDDFDEQGRFLDSDQRIDARQMIGCGWAVRDVVKVEHRSVRHCEPC